MLSFQEDEDIEEPEKKIEKVNFLFSNQPHFFLNQKKESKMKSSHDVLNDPFLKKEAIVNLAELELKIFFIKRRKLKNFPDSKSKRKKKKN